MKQFTIIGWDGVETVFRPARGKLPTLQEMQSIVKGPIELVRVLREKVLDETGRWEYTYMVCNEVGLIEGLPRNQKATDVYLANVRRQFPDAENPYKAARGLSDAKWKAKGAEIHDLDPPGHADDPYIAGDVLLFEGYTCEELQAMGF